MDKKEIREKRYNLITLLVGIALSIGLLFIYREGLAWFSATQWSKVSIISWVSIGITLGIALVLQYYFLMLLRYSAVKYIVLWFIPIAWLFNNGLVAMHRFLDWTTDIVSPAAWLPLGDLLGWLLSAVYLPLLIGSGVIIGIIDSSSSMLTQACYYAGIAMEVAGISPANIISYSLNLLSVYWDLISNAFVQEIVTETMKNRDFFEFNLSNIFSLPYWVFSIGYSFTCIVI